MSGYSFGDGVIARRTAERHERFATQCSSALGRSDDPFRLITERRYSQPRATTLISRRSGAGRFQGRRPMAAAVGSSAIPMPHARDDRGRGRRFPSVPSSAGIHASGRPPQKRPSSPAVLGDAGSGGDAGVPAFGGRPPVGNARRRRPCRWITARSARAGSRGTPLNSPPLV